MRTPWFRAPVETPLGVRARCRIVGLEVVAAGVGLLVHDGYRPWYVTRMFRGAAIEMVSTYDETTERAVPDDPGGTTRQRRYRDVPRQPWTPRGSPSTKSSGGITIMQVGSGPPLGTPRSSASAPPLGAVRFILHHLRNMTSTLLKAAPDHHDAEIVMTLYDLRREAVMRASREAINKDLWPKSFDELQAVTKYDHPLNAPFRQVTAYWEMAYGMVKHGILHGDFMLESGTEGLYVFARVKPFLAPLRELTGARAFINAEWVANHSAFSREYMARLEPRIAQMTLAK